MSAEFPMKRKLALLILPGYLLAGTSAAHPQDVNGVLEKLADVLTLAYVRDPRLEKALEEYWQSISDAQLDKELYVGMRDRLLAVPLVAEAESLMLQATALHPDSRQLHFRLGEVYV